MNMFAHSLLQEQIPMDLAPLYKKANYKKQYTSLEHPQSKHSEIGKNIRRNISYDYHNAEYKEVSAEEAIRDIKGKVHPVSSYRLIYDIGGHPSLVEYEKRRNGDIYAVYVQGGSYPVDITVPNTRGELVLKHYENIRDAGWKDIFRTASKIYWTDEYEHQIIPDDVDRAEWSLVLTNARNSGKNGVRYFAPYELGNQGYDAHRPFNNMKGYPQWLLSNTSGTVDTGRHTDLYREKNISPLLKTVQKHLETKDISTFHSFKSHCLQAYNDKKEKYNNYSEARKALKRLDIERERLSDTEDAMSSSEYNYKKYILTKNLEEARKLYLEACSVFLECHDSEASFIDEASQKITEKIHAMVEQHLKMLSEIYSLKALCDELINSDPTDITDFSYQDMEYKVSDQLQRYNRLLNHIKQKIYSNYENIRKALRLLSTMTDNMQSSENDETINLRTHEIELWESAQKDLLTLLADVTKEYDTIYDNEITLIKDNIQAITYQLAKKKSGGVSELERNKAKDILTQTDVIEFD